MKLKPISINITLYGTFASNKITLENKWIILKAFVSLATYFSYNNNEYVACWSVAATLQIEQAGAGGTQICFVTTLALKRAFVETASFVSQRLNPGNDRRRGEPG